MFGLDVHANQNIPAGKTNPPTIIGGRRASGTTRPSLSKALLNVVVEVYAVRLAPATTPTMTARKGKAPTPGFQPRYTWKVIG